MEGHRGERGERGDRGERGERGESSGMTLEEARSAHEMDRRMTAIEINLTNLIRRLDDHTVTMTRAVENLELRQRSSEITTARLIGGLVVAQFLTILFAPVIRNALGLSV